TGQGHPKADRSTRLGIFRFGLTPSRWRLPSSGRIPKDLDRRQGGQRRMHHDLIRRVETLGHPRILVVGDLILDRYIWGDAERISQEAPVPLLRADSREHRLGGAASVATMLRALGAEVELVGGVGTDV